LTDSASKVGNRYSRKC